MAGELIRYPSRSAVFAPHYFGSVSYYALLAAYPRVCVDLAMRADKRHKSVHRCNIVDTRGEIMLTVPVARLGGHPSWSEVMVSPHGSWWTNHLTALASAYGRTPYYEYYAGRIAAAIGRDHDVSPITVADLCRRCDTAVRRILGIDTHVTYSAAGTLPDDDYRLRDLSLPAVPYWQIRAGRLGFRPDLSVLDLIFNLGPEAPLILRRMQPTLPPLPHEI